MDTPCGDREYRRKMIIEVGCQLASATGFRRSPSKSVGVVIGGKKGGGPPSLFVWLNPLRDGGSAIILILAVQH